MSQLGKFKNSMNFSQDLRKSKNLNNRLTPRQVFAKIYGLESKDVKSETNKSVKMSSNFLYNAQRYCLAGIDDPFKQELRYISKSKYDL